MIETGEIVKQTACSSHIENNKWYKPAFFDCLQETQITWWTYTLAKSKSIELKSIYELRILPNY